MNVYYAKLAALTAAAVLSWESALVCQAQSGPSRTIVFADVVKLAQAHQSDDVIIAYIRGSGASFALTADEIIYLSNQGVSQSAISVLQNSSAPVVGGQPIIPNAPPMGDSPLINPPPPGPVQPIPVSAPAPEAPEVTFDYFHNRLGAEGMWMEIPGYGQCWRPYLAMRDLEWRPYYHRGHWVYTENGWFWQSEDPWGEIVFHYGRWHHHPLHGWLWVPGYDWAPSWVSWRHSEGYLGWAPLPPEARFTVGVGLSFNGRVGMELDFGLTEAHYNFVSCDHFWEHDLYRYHVPHDRVVIIFGSSRVSNTYRVEGRRFVNEGFGRERVELVTHRTIVVERPVIRDPIVARHVERTVVVVKPETGGPRGGGRPGTEASRPPGNAGGQPGANPGAVKPNVPPATAQPAGNRGAPGAAPVGTAPSATTGGRGNTYSSGTAGTGANPSTGGANPPPFSSTGGRGVGTGAGGAGTGGASTGGLGNGTAGSGGAVSPGGGLGVQPRPGGPASSLGRSTNRPGIRR